MENSASSRVPTRRLFRRLLVERWFVVVFVALFALTYIGLQLPFADEGRFLMEKDQLDLLHGALSGVPGGFSVGGTSLKTLPALQWLYWIYFWFSSDLVGLFWLLGAIELVAFLGLYLVLRPHLPLFGAELLALLLLFDSHRHHDFWTMFLPNSHSPAFVVALILLLILFHLRGRFAFWHGANVLVCFLVNLHLVNGALVLLPLVFAAVNRRRFSRRDVLFSFIPYAVFLLLLLPQAGAFGSVFQPHFEGNATTSSVAAIVESALRLFADHSTIGVLAVLGLGVAIYDLALASPVSEVRRALAMVALAGLAALTLSYILVGEVLHVEGAYRCRAFFPAILIVHFSTIWAAIRWLPSARLKSVTLLVVFLLVPVHAFDRVTGADSGLGVALRTSAPTSEQVYGVLQGRRLARRLVREHGVSSDMLRVRVHVPPLHKAFRFFLSAESRAHGSASRVPLGDDEHLVVELLDRDLSFQPHTVTPCLDYTDLRLKGDAVVACRSPDTEARYLYMVVSPDAAPALRLELDGQALPLMKAPAFTYTMWDGMQVFRTVQPIDLANRTGAVMRSSAPPPNAIPELFESPVLLGDRCLERRCASP